MFKSNTKQILRKCIYCNKLHMKRGCPRGSVMKSLLQAMFDTHKDHAYTCTLSMFNAYMAHNR